MNNLPKKNIWSELNETENNKEVLIYLIVRDYRNKRKADGESNMMDGL